MRLWSSKLALACIYAIVLTVGVSYNRGPGIAFWQKSRYDEEYFYERHFRPIPRPHANASVSSHAPELPDNANHHTAYFPIKTHILTHGKARTATTLLFNMVGVSYFLYLANNDREQIPVPEVLYLKRYGIKNKANGRVIPLKQINTTKIIKTHLSLDADQNSNAVVFSTAESRKEAAEIKRNLTKDGHTVAFVQDMESLKEVGVRGLVDEYVAGYGLSEKDNTNLNVYFNHWQILRQCCGQQMSVTYRNDMLPEKFKLKAHKRIPNINQPNQSICNTYDIDSIEQAFMKTELFGMIEQYPSSSFRSFNKPSLKDGTLNGTYCSSYNSLVRTQGLSIWGIPGGRSERSPLDRAIMGEIRKGRQNLTKSGHYLFPNTDKPIKEQIVRLRKRSEKSKKTWLKAVLAAGGKTYADYGFETSDDTDNIVSDTSNNVGVGDIDSTDNSNGIKSENNNGMKRSSRAATSRSDAISIYGFNITHAIFLISFGEEASESTLVERCILSLRRRGAWHGYIVVLTDAPPERYENEWDDKVIIMHPLKKHLELAEGKPLQFTPENRSLKSKRFKTFIIDYCDQEKRLDSIELIYYLDIDIMAGNSVSSLFSGLERKYKVSREERNVGLSKLYFFSPLSKIWPLQSGTFIVERRSSSHCLELWRNEIDKLTLSGRGRDQDALRTVYERTESGDESKCQLMRMNNENFVTFPTPRTWDTQIANKMMNPKATYHNLIHISNSVFSKWIDEEKQNTFIHELLQLSEEEKPKYGKVSVKAKETDM